MKALVIFADGFEEIEAISAVDILRRAGADVLCAGLDGEVVKGARGALVKTDATLGDINAGEFSAVVLPGGMPGASNLANSVQVGEILRNFNERGKLIAAICAAPMALAVHGVLSEKWTCYPGFEGRVREDKSGFTGSQKIVKCGNVITSRGPATAMEFALAVARELCGEKIYRKLRDELLIDLA